MQYKQRISYHPELLVSRFPLPYWKIPSQNGENTFFFQMTRSPRSAMKCSVPNAGWECRLRLQHAELKTLCKALPPSCYLTMPIVPCYCVPASANNTLESHVLWFVGNIWHLTTIRRGRRARTCYSSIGCSCQWTIFGSGRSYYGSNLSQFSRD